MNDLLLPHFVVTLHHRGGLCQSPDVDSGLLGLLPFLLLFAALGLVLALQFREQIGHTPYDNFGQIT